MTTVWSYIVSLRPKLATKRKQQQRKGFDAELLQQVDQWAEYLLSIRRSFDHRKGQGNVEERWNELKVTIVRSAEERLQSEGEEEGILKMAGTLNRCKETQRVCGLV